MKYVLKFGLMTRTAFLTLTILCITLFAIVTGLYSFHQYKLTIEEITGPQLELLLTATKLLQQSDAIISSSSRLLLATKQEDRRRALFEIADRSDWMDKLIVQLQSLSQKSESFYEVLLAKENLIKNLHELDAIVEQRILSSQVSRDLPPNGGNEMKESSEMTQELNSVMQKNSLYSTELSIAVGYHVAKVKDLILENAEHLEKHIDSRRYELIAAAMLSVATVFAIAFYIQMSIVRRILRLQKAVEDGKPLPSDIPIAGNDEITKLAQTVKMYVEKGILDEAHILNINKELSFLATHDSLTTLYNRRHFETLAVQLTVSSDILYSIVIIDIDNFKRINDAYGHKTGDLALVHMATTIKSGLRGSDILARYGGEEFVVMMLNADDNVAFNVIERIRHTVERTPFQADVGAIHMTASFGLAQCNDEQQTVDECLRCADVALYAAKNGGRNTVVIYTPELNDS